MKSTIITLTTVALAIAATGAAAATRVMSAGCCPLCK